jgi:hypothetical protein
MQVGSGTLDMLAMERDLIDHRIDIRDSQGSQVIHTARAMERDLIDH